MDHLKNKLFNILKINSTLIVLLFFLLYNSKVFANDINNVKFESPEFSSEYKNYINLSDEQKAKTIEPSMYNPKINYIGSSNPTYYSKYISAMVTGATSIPSNFDLRNILSKENMTVKNQSPLESCWAFANTASAETTLALSDYYANKNPTTYDFSEKHLDYLTSKQSVTGNPYGINRKVGTMGSYQLSDSYYMNGLGPVAEKDFPFNGSTETINYSSVSNINRTATVYDTVTFPTRLPTDDNTIIKEFIMKHGAVSAPIHGDAMFNATTDSDAYYNEKTAAIYCDDATKFPIDHSVAIVGWDDNFSVDNFLESRRPKNKGAWIIKNSWGDKDVRTMDEMKQLLFNLTKNQLIQNGITSYNQISDNIAVDTAKQLGYKYENNEFVFIKGDYGFMYVSYDDVNICKENWGIENIKYGNNDDQVFTYCESYPKFIDIVSTGKDTNFYIKNIFENNKANQSITSVGIHLSQTQTIKVYINPNGDSSNDAIPVELSSGMSKTLEPGSHRIDLKEPLKIGTGKFCVVFEIDSGDPRTIEIPTEQVSTGDYSTSKIEENKTFFGHGSSLSSATWKDLAKMYDATNEMVNNGNSSIIAYTKDDSSIVEPTPTETGITIVNLPTKTTYYEGENFDSSGMVVVLNLSDGTKKKLESNDYKIVDGNNLKLNTTTVTIKYNDFTANINIKVNKKAADSQNNVEDTNTTKEDTNTSKEDNVKKNDFSNAKGKFTDIKYNTSSESNGLDFQYVIKVSDIYINKNENNEFYFYISQNNNESNIENWKIINNPTITDNSITFTVSQDDYSALKQMDNANSLFLYLKSESNSGVSISSDIALTMDDNVKIKISENGEVKKTTTVKEVKDVAKQSNNSSSNYNDSTIKSGKLPQTGTTAALSIVIGFALIFGIHSLISYKKIEKM